MKKISKNSWGLYAFSFIGLLFFFLAGNNAFAQLTAKANHDHIKIDFFYSGSTVSVSGISDPGTDLIIKITSPEGHQTLRKKGKVAGLLWMNVGELKLDHVPNVYFIHSTKKIEDILSNEEMQKYVIGYPALEKHVEISPVDDKQDGSKWFAEFLKFKESKNLFGSSNGKITTIEKTDGLQHYYILTQWPYQAPPGDYTVTVYAVKDKKVIETASANVNVEQVGTVKTLASMAKNKGALYGLLSIAIAIAAGFGVGLVFRKSGGAH
jgi:uncharacterized protein (TIGR02186 family)